MLHLDFPLLRIVGEKRTCQRPYVNTFSSRQCPLTHSQTALIKPLTLNWAYNRVHTTIYFLSYSENNVSLMKTPVCCVYSGEESLCSEIKIHIVWVNLRNYNVKVTNGLLTTNFFFSNFDAVWHKESSYNKNWCPHLYAFRPAEDVGRKPKFWTWFSGRLHSI
jgi:hypothetical protein